MRYMALFDSRIPGYEGRKLNVIADSISHFKDGFWVNEDGNFTVDSDAMYWIPPSRILFVEKVK